MALKPCPRCGKMISDKAEKCPKCGLDLRNISKQVKAQGAQNVCQQTHNGKLTANNSSAQRSNPTIIERPHQSVQLTQIDKPKKSKTGLWIFLCIILGVGIGAAIWIPVHHHNEKLKAEQLARIEQHRLDSIAIVEAELARLEKIRQDSIELELYKESIDNQFVTPKDIFTSYKNGDEKGLEKMLIEKGYKLTKTERFEDLDPSDEDNPFIFRRKTYALESTNPEYPVWNKVITYPDGGGNGWTVLCDIEFCDEEHIQSFIQKSLKLGLKKENDGDGIYRYERYADNYKDSWGLREYKKSLTLTAYLP